MKGKKILSVLLTLALLVGLSVPALGAKTFTDLVRPNGEDHWAKEYILRLAERGLFEGYGDGRVGPDDPVLVSAALALCARMSIQDEDVRLQIGADLAGQVNPILPEQYAWLEKEAATCLEMGIVSDAELLLLTGADPLTGIERLGSEICRGDFARYVVRAMGLEDMTYVLSGSDLFFADAEDIEPLLRPYVQLLTQWGVVTGVRENEQYYFYPDKSLTRAECATMLERALEKMELNNVSVEIPRYTGCAWDSGYVDKVDVEDGGARVLTLRSPFSETVTLEVKLPVTTKVYLYNKYTEQDKFTALRVGYFARVCYGADGVTPESVRVTPSNLLTQASGSCDELGTGSITVDGAPYRLNRFTKVSAGGNVGDSSIIDYSAAYTNADVTCDAGGNVLHLALTGGSRVVTGIVNEIAVTASAAGSKTSVTVTGLNGSNKIYEVPETAAVIVGGNESTLKETFKGRFITLRVLDDDLATVVSVEIDPISTYVQGILRSVDLISTIPGVDVTEPGAGKRTTYRLSGECAITYMGKATTLEDLKKNNINSFVTLLLEGGTVVSLSAYPGYETVEGTLTAIDYNDPTVLTVSQADGTISTFSIPTERLSAVAIFVDGKAADMSQLRKGDGVTVTVQYNQVSQVDAVHQEANVTGTVQSVTRKADGSVVLEVALSDGTSDIFTASAFTTVTREGVVSTLTSISPNERVKLLVEDKEILSIEVSGAVQSQNQLSGAVYQTDVANRTMTLLVRDSTGSNTLVKVQLASGAKIWDVPTNSEMTSLSRIHENDVLRVWGNYDVTGMFIATSAIREQKA